VFLNPRRCWSAPAVRFSIRPQTVTTCCVFGRRVGLRPKFKTKIKTGSPSRNRTLRVEDRARSVLTSSVATSPEGSAYGRKIQIVRVDRYEKGIVVIWAGCLTGTAAWLEEVLCAGRKRPGNLAPG